MACAVATHNLGEFAEMDGNIAEARVWRRLLGSRRGLSMQKRGYGE